jgi:3-methyl-2-oxobutanoate hydroxymethyltransferase
LILMSIVSRSQSTARSNERPDKRTVPWIVDQKGSDEPLTMVTAYDAPTARIVSDADVDMILVGDSLAMVVLGYDDTLQVTIQDMAHHTAAVARARPKSLIVGDMPWMSYHTTTDDAVRNAAELIRAGADAIKLEGGAKRLPVIEAILAAEIPVMGHLGLTPQSIKALGGHKVQAKEALMVKILVEDAIALADAGCFAIVLECVPDGVARLVSEAIHIPTIGIGAGAETDGQVLVFHDLVGIQDQFTPRFVRRYAHIGRSATEAVGNFVSDVRHRAYPSADESYPMNQETAEVLGLYGSA